MGSKENSKLKDGHFSATWFSLFWNSEDLQKISEQLEMEWGEASGIREASKAAQCLWRPGGAGWEGGNRHGACCSNSGVIRVNDRAVVRNFETRS